MSTQRDSKRIAIELGGNYRVWESDFPFAGITPVNISHTGICFRTDQSVESGHSVELKLKLADKTRSPTLIIFKKGESEETSEIYSP